ncbi:MAG: type II secretion system F family protein [Planctomycetota bacterium]|nr:type II secretion system F family protein [Planctomycetota bacterium]
MTLPQLVIFLLMLAIVPLALWWMQWLWTLTQSKQRLASNVQSYALNEEAGSEASRSRLGWWLFQSGYRSPNATKWFSLASLGCALLAGVAAYAISQSEVLPLLESLLYQIPGAVGEVFLPIVWLMPYAAVLTLGAMPAAIVRAKRRKRVTQIEQDLPLALDLLATLAEAGLSFDAALDRVLENQRRERPLAQDFRLFRLEILTGRPRIESLRRLNRHVNVPWFSIFISALIHAEQVGAGLAATLRAQADDLRSRRRERALAMAMAVPVKLLFPLIVCFLPGIMIAALGPILYEIVQALDSVIGRGFGF